MRTTSELVDLARHSLGTLGVDPARLEGELMARSPITDSELFGVAATDPEGVGWAVSKAYSSFMRWRLTPAPVRGQVVKRLGQLISEHKETLADLITIEVGKIRSEALGEVQEMIDICDFAVGLSRQLYGKTMPSERPGHRLQEQWHPLGVVGVITSFNFPMAVWSWNTAVALVCGDSIVWKPSELAPLCALGCSALVDQALREFDMPEGVHSLVVGGPDVGEALVDDNRVALVSATGSTRMGANVGPRVAARFGRSLLELSGNNAVIVTPSADLDLAVESIVFAAAGTAGQRCTSLRRLFVHNSVIDEVVSRVRAAFDRLVVGDPWDSATLVGPLVNERAYRAMADALDGARADGGEVVTGGDRIDLGSGGFWARPALVRMPRHDGVVLRETFAPILYVLPYENLEEAMVWHNSVSQGLSAGIFTSDHAEAEFFLGPDGADTGIANVNVGTSGAEIGGAFGGEKETGGGRESGSDAWRNYMRRATNTINFSGRVQLAQGVDFSG
jgi:aldehyde dehydrogenase (NAD+)